MAHSETLRAAGGQDEAALIELIQTHLPQELTGEQIAQIRARMADSPGIQDALLEELSLEQGLAIRYAPPITNFQEVISRIERLAILRQRKHWALWFAVAVLSVGLLGGGITLVVMSTRGPGGPQPEATAANTATDNQGGPSAKGAAGGSATRPSDPRTKGPRGTGGTGTDAAPTTGPAQPAEDLPAARMTWQEYVQPDLDKNFNWAGEVDRIFKGLHDRQPRWTRDKRTCDLLGTFKLISLPAPGRMLRLGIRDAEKCDLDLWRGNEGVRISLQDRRGQIEGRTLSRRRAGAEPVATGTCDDAGAWRWFSLGAVDIRWQGGEVLVCRGEFPLLRLPLSGPPTEGSLVEAHTSVWLAEARACKPLPLPAQEADPASITVTPAGQFAWKPAPQGQATLDAQPNKAVVLSARDAAHAGKASFSIDLAPGTAAEATLHVRDCTPRTGLYVRVAGREFHIWVAAAAKSSARAATNVLVRDRGSREAVEESLLKGFTVDNEFRARVRLGLDHVSVWASRDGKRWWRWDYSGDLTTRDSVEIGLEVADGSGGRSDQIAPRTICLGDVRVRRFEGLGRLADAGLVLKARSALSEEARKADKRSAAGALLAKARPADAPAEAWEMACDAALAAHAQNYNVRQDAAEELLLAAASRGADTDVPAVLAAARELAQNTRADSRESAACLRDVLEALGRSCLEAGKDAPLSPVMDASYQPPGDGGSQPNRTFREVWPGELLRLRLLDLMARDEWESVRLEALRFGFLARGAEIPDSGRRESADLLRWALASAQAQVANAPDPNLPELSPRWLPPLALQPNREMLNVMGEFLVLVADKSYDSAAKAITRQALPNELVPLGDEEDLLESSHFKVREVLHTTPQLRQVLRDQHQAIGMIRLRRARRQNDLQMLRSLAAQFHGTQPGLEASHALADRDLANGDFYAAAAGYHALLGEADYSRRRDAEVKYRLASAMLGQLAGEPVTDQVALPGGTFSPEEFERMIQQLAKEHVSAAVAAEAAPAAAPPPGWRHARLVPLAEAPVRKNPRGSPPRYPAAFAGDANRLYVYNWCSVFAADPRARNRVWQYEPQQQSQRPEPIAAAKPLAIGKRLYVRSLQKGKLVLLCLDAQKGERLWSDAYDDAVLSDPILIDSWLYVITGKEVTGGVLELRLHRVSPDTGESALSSPLVQVRSTMPEIGRPAKIEDGIIFRATGCLVSCDFRGEIRWVRRLLFVPPDVWESLYYDMPPDDMVIWKDRHVIFTSAGSPGVLCVDGQTGQKVWSRTLSGPGRLVGLVGGSVILAREDSIRAIDPDTGATRWRRRGPIDLGGLLIGQKDSIVLVRLNRPGSRRGDEERYVRWISAKDGSTLLEHKLDEPALYDVVGLFSDGRRIYGLSNFDGKKMQGTLFAIESGG